MTPSMHHSWTRATLWSAAATVPLLALLTVLAELQPSLKQWLADAFSHHWLGKSVLGIGVFALLVLLCRLLPADGEQERALPRAVYALALAGSVATIGLIVFYVLEWFV